MIKEMTRTLPALFHTASKAHGGAANFGDLVGLKHNTEPVLATALENVNARRDDYEQAKDDLAARRLELREITAACRAFATLARDLLKPTLGSQYSEAWDGF